MIYSLSPHIPNSTQQPFTHQQLTNSQLTLPPQPPLISDTKTITTFLHRHSIRVAPLEAYSHDDSSDHDGRSGKKIRGVGREIDGDVVVVVLMRNMKQRRVSFHGKDRKERRRWWVVLDDVDSYTLLIYVGG